MPRLTVAEQTQLARLLLDRSCRSASARLKKSSLLRWRYGPPRGDKLLIVPQDLRTGDPSFVSEDELGHFGLAGILALTRGRSPFEITPPDPAWERELHGFGWLRHFYAAGHVGARDRAIALVVDWCRSHGRQGLTWAPGIVWEPAVASRRIMSWIVNATLILDEVDHETYDLVTESLADQVIHLAASWRHAPEGYRRLEALTGLLMWNVCSEGRDKELEATAKAFSLELAQQILPDGGHVSRNPQVVLDLLLDFLPLRQCFATRERKLPDGFDAACKRMLAMLRYLRLGDGRLARFNGMSAHMIDALSTVLAYDEEGDLLSSAPHSGYERLQQGGLVVLMDVGRPPPLNVSGSAGAGCLSFELSSGAEPIFVNAGAPPPSAAEWAARARATASHNTLCLGGTSSSRLVQNGQLETLLEGAPIRYPEGVESKVSDFEGGIAVDAFHDGYFQRFKLLHRRRIELCDGGSRICGTDRLGPQRGKLRLPHDVPFAINFHLGKHVACAAEDGDESATALLTLKDGQRWRFGVTGAALSIEESIHFADPAGPGSSLQIVLRGATYGESEVRWNMERVQ